MIGFPGRIFDGEGHPLDGLSDDLTQDRLDASQHRSAVQSGKNDNGMMRPVAVIWLLNDAAAFKDVPPGILSASVEAAMNGQAILILSRLPDVGVEFRDGLIEALDLAEAPDDVAGYA
jgi:hypothetical protein